MKPLYNYLAVNTVPFSFREEVGGVVQDLAVLAADVQEAVYTSTRAVHSDLHMADLVLQGPVRLQRQRDRVNKLIAAAEAEGGWRDEFLLGLARPLRQLIDQLAEQQHRIGFADVFWTQARGVVTGTQLGFNAEADRSHLINGIAVLFGLRLQPLFSVPKIPSWVDVEDLLEVMDAPTSLGFGYIGALHLYENPHDFNRLNHRGGYAEMVTVRTPQHVALLDEIP